MSIIQQLVFLCAFTSAASTLVNVSLVAMGLGEPRTVPSFSSFISTHDRKYSIGTSEYDMRSNIYEKRLQEIEKHNSNPHRRWNAGVNHLTDQTDAELKRLRGLKRNPSSKKSGGSAGVVRAHKAFLGQVKNVIVPDQVSWAHLKAVQEDVNQAACGSCWAIATSTMLRANAEIRGRGRSFSTQELVDCVPNPKNCGGSGGCDGATVELAMNWIMDKGLDTNAGTPYYATDGKCKKPANPALLQDYDKAVEVGVHAAASETSGGALVGLLGWERLPENKYQPLLEAVATRGPVAISVGADYWNSYEGGIFDGCGVDATVDHAVTLIGYGTDPIAKEKYWHIKNSWGNGWGEGGTIRMLRPVGDTHCGTDYKPSDGTGCDGGPATVPVCGMCGMLYDSVVPHM